MGVLILNKLADKANAIPFIVLFYEKKFLFDFSNELLVEILAHITNLSLPIDWDSAIFGHFTITFQILLREREFVVKQFLDDWLVIL